MAPLTSMESLTYVCLITLLMWMPYILDQSYSNGQLKFLYLDGLWAKMHYCDEKKMRVPMHDWAVRAAAAHKNAVENLVVFAALVFLCDRAGADADGPAFAYFLARLAHWPFQVIGPALPVARTLAFGVGWACCLYMVYLAL